MIELYSWSTPNGRKVSILLEELGIEYKIFPINFNKNEHLTEKYKKISPNIKIPSIVDTDNKKSIFESGAILLYLSKKYDKFFNYNKEWETYSWLMYQMSEVGPMLGQAHQFLYYNKGKSQYAENIFKERAIKIYSILEKRLEMKEFIIDEYSIVDISIWPWIARYERQQIDIFKFPNILQWFKRISKREAVQKGYNIVGDNEKIPFG